MFSSRILALAVIVSTVFVAVILLPDSDEKATMLLRDQKFSQAYEELNRLYEAGDNQPHLMLQLVELNEYYGKIENIEPILLDFQQKHPNSLAARTKLIEFYLNTLQFPEYIKQLKALLDLDHNVEHLDRLLALFRFNGAFDEERKLLEKFQPTTIFTAAHAARLGLIYLSGATADKAMIMFRHMDELDRTSNEYWPARLAMFRLLVGQRLADEAHMRAQFWVANDNVSSHLFTMVNHLQNRGRRDLAIALSDAAMKTDTDVALSLADMLIQENQLARAQLYLARWVQRSPSPSPASTSRYVRLSIASKNLPAAINLLLSRGPASIGEEALVSIGQELVYQNQTSLLNTIRPYFTLQGLTRSPLFAAQLFDLQGDRTLAMHFLDQVQTVSLEDYQSVAWFSLLKKYFGEQQAIEHVGSLMPQHKLPRPLLREYADTAYQMGLMQEYETAWVALGGHE